MGGLTEVREERIGNRRKGFERLVLASGSPKTEFGKHEYNGGALELGPDKEAR